MRKLTIFSFITLNGYSKGSNEDISWHIHGAEENQYAVDMMQAGNILLFGRVTYEMMANYWPSTYAMENDPLVAKGMNSAEKIVFTNTLKKVDWNNTKIINGDIVEEVKKLKSTKGNDLTLMGSGTILTLFAEHDLIDEYKIMIDPIAIGNGTPIFQNIKTNLNLKLENIVSFKSGVVLLTYKPK